MIDTLETEFVPTVASLCSSIKNGDQYNIRVYSALLKSQAESATITLEHIKEDLLKEKTKLIPVQQELQAIRNFYTMVKLMMKYSNPL